MSSSEYEKKAKAVAKKLGIVLEIIPAKEQTAPPWDAKKDGGGGKRAHGVKYHVTVKRAYNNTQAFAFDYWGSVHDAEVHEAPSLYDVFSSISSDAAGPTEPDEVVSEFGPMAPSRAIAIADFAKKLQKFFTADELTALAEIDQ